MYVVLDFWADFFDHPYCRRLPFGAFGYHGTGRSFFIGGCRHSAFVYRNGRNFDSNDPNSWSVSCLKF